MFPYKDDNPTLSPAFLTVGLIVVTVAVWVTVQGAGTQPALGKSICQLGAIPGELLGLVPSGTRIPIGPNQVCQVGGDAAWHTVLTSVFLHGGWFHLIGNMWFLWVFGNNIEDVMGPSRFVAFYLSCGILAAMAQILTQPSSPVPMVGASGAISGIMGGYLVLYPRVRVHMLVFLGFFVTTLAVPAYVMLLYWAFLQLLGGLPTLSGGASGGGVAFFAHLGGFVAGVALIKPFAKRRLVEAHRRHTTVHGGSFRRGF